MGGETFAATHWLSLFFPVCRRRWDPNNFRAVEHYLGAGSSRWVGGGVVDYNGDSALYMCEVDVTTCTQTMNHGRAPITVASVAN